VRRALALSRNVVAIKVAEAVGYQQVVNVWKRVGVGTPAKAYPSIALGVFEASPVEIATAYTLFTNNGSVRPLQALTRMWSATSRRPSSPCRRGPSAKPETAFLVTNLMRAVLNEGTGAGVRSAGFTLDAAGKTGTTNDLRDAWFVGFTPELLTVVWVGLDDNQPIGLSGSQAAPADLDVVHEARARQPPSASFEAPEGITYATIDKDTGKLATPMCPRTINEAFLAGTAPTDYCDVHGGNPVSGFFSKFGSLLKRIGRD
jgi:penicillin-binding protein 1B